MDRHPQRGWSLHRDTMHLLWVYAMDSEPPKGQIYVTLHVFKS